MTNESNIESATATLAERRPRTDMRTRDLVNQAVASVPALGLPQAAEFLAAMGVPSDVAVRALVYPDRRRMY